MAIIIVTLLKIEGDQELVEGPKRPYLDHFYTFTEGDIEVDETPTQVKLENLEVGAWTLPKSEQLRKMNLEITEDPYYLRINAHIDEKLAAIAESLLWEY